MGREYSKTIEIAIIIEDPSVIVSAKSVIRHPVSNITNSGFISYDLCIIEFTIDKKEHQFIIPNPSLVFPKSEEYSKLINAFSKRK